MTGRFPEAITAVRAASGLVVAIGAMGLAACGGPAATRPPPVRSSKPVEPEPVHRLPGRHFVAGCDDPRVTGGLPADYRRQSVVVGPLAIYPARSEYLHLSRDDFAPVTRGVHRFAALDAAVTVAPGARVTVVVPHRERRMLSLLFDHSRYGDANRGYTVEDGDRAVTFPGCFRPYTQYQGGFVVTRAHCARLRVYGAGARRVLQARISFGARICKGH